MTIKMFASMFLLGALVTGCATSDNLESDFDVPMGSQSRTVEEAHLATKACLQSIPETRSLLIAVSNIPDKGSFTRYVYGKSVSSKVEGVEEYILDVLDGLGIKYVDATNEFFNTLDDRAKHGVGIKPIVPDYDLKGSVTSITPVADQDFSFAGYGFGPRITKSQAVGTLDLRIVTPDGQGVVTSKSAKDFVIYQSKFGGGRIIGGGNGLTFASFEAGTNLQVSTQYATRFLAAFGAYDLVIKLLTELYPHQQATLNLCRQQLGA